MAELAYIGIGSNLGDRQAELVSGLAGLLAVPGVELDAVSSVYETDPVGYLDQPAFLNAVCSVRTALEPQDLLRAMQRLEADHHRQRRIPWGPRTLDLDLLLYGTIQLTTGDLLLPHPQMTERAFVLVPLGEIAPGLRHPVTGKPFAASLRDLGDHAAVRCMGPFPKPSPDNEIANHA
jgi:2-amino-4-hydroxy-6-hydroxymethyldihydropteridine diphosphokinase